jgi:hypothetical protein
VSSSNYASCSTQNCPNNPLEFCGATGFLLIYQVAPVPSSSSITSSTTLSSTANTTSTGSSSSCATSVCATPTAAAYCTGGGITALGTNGATYTPECGETYTGTSGGTYHIANGYYTCLEACDNDQNECVSFSFLLTLTLTTSNCYLVYNYSALPVTEPHADSGTILR